jgi:hypothetical protein
MLEILLVNAWYTKGKYIIQESMVPEKKSFHSSLSKDVSLEMTWQAIDDFELVTVSNTEYELEMITGLDDMINFCQKFCKSIIILKFLFASFWISQTDLT